MIERSQKVGALAGTLSLSLLLAACGGGGGGGGSVTAGTAQPLAAPVSPGPAITLSAVAAPPLTSADCNRLQSDALAQVALNLANPQINQLNALLQRVDPELTWRVFTRAPEVFINWVIQSNGTGRLDALSIGTAAHETMHTISSTITDQCVPTNNYKLHWFSTTYATNLVAGSTPAYNIVDTVLPAGLKGSARYNRYILSLGNTPGNGFNVLLDELAAYTGQAIAEYQWIATRGETNFAAMESGLGGTIEFMAWVQAYLAAVRTTNVAAWNAINTDAQAKAALQTMWTRAEQIIATSYPQTQTTDTPQLQYDRAVFDYIYQVGPLNELMLLGITTRSRASWMGTYL